MAGTRIEGNTPSLVSFAGPNGDHARLLTKGNILPHERRTFADSHSRLQEELHDRVITRGVPRTCSSSQQGIDL
jgi:hypothetical protein